VLFKIKQNLFFHSQSNNSCSSSSKRERKKWININNSFLLIYLLFSYRHRSRS
jgi:hypothetical protein